MRLAPRWGRWPRLSCCAERASCPRQGDSTMVGNLLRRSLMGCNEGCHHGRTASSATDRLPPIPTIAQEETAEAVNLSACSQTQNSGASTRARTSGPWPPDWGVYIFAGMLGSGHRLHHPYRLLIGRSGKLSGRVPFSAWALGGGGSISASLAKLKARKPVKALIWMRPCAV